ncbi:uncharacterized protein CEXT_67901 [Caerostris extrusa]|uniref:Uncharacterized protein n=1 Tax=Caerostris extrusa TaxID=172846 RepID=A0AAV4VSF0_CAEEX|nr:uncharacterized protein CEXT_67901 [Caerostris extrusa]
MKLTDMGDIVYLDADENKIETPFADLDALPSEVLQSLRHDLKRPQEMLGDAVARAFLKALAQKLNAGQGVNDEFEFELTSHEDKASFRLRNQYRDWVSNMKKEGGAFFKNVKTKMKDTSKKSQMVSDEAPEVPKLKSIHKKVLSKSVSKDGPHTVVSALAASELLQPMSPVRRNVVDSPQLTFQSIDVDLMGDLHEVIFRSCSLCNNSRTSISDPQLIDLSLEDKVPCGPSCVASPLRSSSNIPQTPSDLHPPPLLPRPPSSKSRLTSRSSGSLSEPSDTPPELLIQLDSCGSTDFSQTSHFTSVDSFSELEQTNILNTNPFHEPLSTPCPELSIFKSYSGPNVRNMVNRLQSSNSPQPQYLSSSSEGLKANYSSTNKVQNLSRTLSTPPSACSSTYNEPPSMLVLKSASKVSTNPFVVADSKNNNCKEKYEINNISANLSTWENFQ